MRRSILQKAAGAFMACALVAGSLSMAAVAAAPEKAQAKESIPYMKTLKLKWDLKKNKSRTISETYAGLSKKKKCTFKIKNWKETTTTDGYKKLSFTIAFTRNYKLTKVQAHKCVNSKEYQKHWSVGGERWFSIADYDTGRDLEYDNSLGVKVKSKWSNSGYQKVKDKHGCWVRIAKYTKVKVSVTYPASYKGMCIGVGGSNISYIKSTDSKYWNGKTVFGQTSFYKKGKTNSHWMRVS